MAQVPPAATPAGFGSPIFQLDLPEVPTDLQQPGRRRVRQMHISGSFVERARQRHGKHSPLRRPASDQMFGKIQPTSPVRYQASQLHRDVVAAGMSEPVALVEQLHARLYGDDAPLRHIDWLSDVPRVCDAAVEAWPEGNVPYMLLLLSTWLAENGQEELADEYLKHVYDRRHDPQLLRHAM